MTDTTKTTEPDLSGLDLFAKARELLDGNGDDTEAVAAIAIEPRDNAAMLEDLSEPNYSKMMREIGAPLRLAAVIVGKTKAELVQSTRGICAGCDDEDEDHPLFEMLNWLHDTSKHLKQFTDLLDSAVARSVIAASAFALEEEPPEQPPA